MNIKNNYVQVLVSAIVLDKKKRVLLLKRGSNNSTYVDFWQLPEGKIENGETPTQAIVREIKEELGQKPKKVEYVNVVPAMVRVKEIKVLVLRIVFFIGIDGEIKMSDDHLQFNWFYKKDLLKEKKLVPGIKEVFDEK